MSFSINRKELERALTTIGKVTKPSKNYAMTGLQNIKVTHEAGGLVLQSTNLDFWMSAHIDAQIVDDGDKLPAVVPFGPLLDAVKGASQPSVVLAMDDTSLAVCDGSLTSTVHLPEEGPDEYPHWPILTEPIVVDLPEGYAESIRQKVLHCVSAEVTRPYLSGVHLHAPAANMLFAEATDGFVAARVGTKLPKLKKDTVNCILPPEPFRFFNPSKLAIDQEQGFAQLETQDYTITTRLIAGPYPNMDVALWDRMTKEADVLKTYRVDRLAFVLAVRALVRRKVAHARLTFTAAYVNVEGLDTDSGDPKLVVETAVRADADQAQAVSEPLLFNATFLLDVLGALETPQITVKLLDSVSKTEWLPTGANGHERYVIMPLRPLDK